MVQQAVQLHIIDEKEGLQLKSLGELRDQIIQVDDFSIDEYNKLKP